MTTGAYPVRNRFDRIMGQVTATTLSLTIVADPAAAARTPWEDLGAGQPLIKATWAGTATGTIQARSSASPPYGVGDAALTDPGAWDLTYDPASGVPAAPWITSGVTTSIVGGLLQIVSPSTGAVYRYEPTIVPRNGPFIAVRFRMGLTAGTGDQQLQFNLAIGTGVYDGNCIAVAGMYTADGVTAYIAWGSTLVLGHLIPGWAYGKLYDIAIVVRATAATVRPRTYEIWYRPVEAGDSDDTLDGFELVGYGFTQAANDYQMVRFGGYWVGGPTAVWGRIRIYDGYDWVTVTSDQAVSSLTAAEQAALSRRYVQMRGWEGGTLTSLNLHTSSSKPTTPSVVILAAVNTTDLEVTWAGTVGQDYRVQFFKDGVLYRTVFTDQPAAALAAPGDGAYTARVTVTSDRNVESDPGDSNEVTLPVASGTPPGAAPSPVTLTPPGFAPGPAYLEDTMDAKIYLNPNPGGTPFATVQIRTSTGSGGTGTVTTVTKTQAQLAAAATFTDDAGDYASAAALGVADPTGKYLSVRYVAEDGQAFETPWILMTDASNRLCVVTGSLPASFVGKNVMITAPEAFVVRQRTFAGTEYASVTSDGAGAATWTATLGRTAAGVMVDGVGTPRYEFVLPNDPSKRIAKAIPDQASALFEDLANIE